MLVHGSRRAVPLYLAPHNTMALLLKSNAFGVAAKPAARGRRSLRVQVGLSSDQERAPPALSSRRRREQQASAREL